MGLTVGDTVTMVGFWDGISEGSAVGECDGVRIVGWTDGLCGGSTDEVGEGCSVGLPVGEYDGNQVGL